MGEAPEFFGPYRVGELLGMGGMGEVHRAYDTVHERQVALKRLPGAAGPEFRARFRREAKIVADLSEPHVVPINAHGEIDGRLYLDMLLVDGPDLKLVLADGPLDPLRTIEILSQVASALDAAHASGVLHRDIKPANILLDSDGTAYLADFGIARSILPDVTQLTETGGHVGTLDYMAPERLTRGDIGVASDVYALACVLFQCLTGRVPFPAADSVGKLAAQLNDPAPAPSLFGRGIPPGLDLVVRTGMDKDPKRRYPSAGELMAAASAVTAEAPTAVANHLPATSDPGQSFFVRLLATMSGPAAPAGGTDVFVDRCPYPGLQSFGAADSEWFFGREQAVRDLLARLSRHRADSGPLIVVGASGAGKSSLLHAGLLAAHARGGSAPRLAMTPGDHPIATLAARLAALTRTDAHRLAWQLRERPSSFGELCCSVTNGPNGSAGPMVVAVDQVEELFTQCADPGEREAFAVALANAWPARVVLAVRADFVEHCIAVPALKPSLDAPYVLGPLGVAELARVVTRPAEASGLELEPGLVDRLITDVGAGRDPGALPRLAHALRETWHNRSGNRLTLKGYQQTGGVDRAVALTADGVYARLAEHDRRALRAALLRMVTLLDGGGIARRRAHRAEVPAPLLESLVAARLVTVDRDFVQLSHDALLTAWPRLREWVAEDRQGLLVRQQLGEAAAGWRSGGQDKGDLYRGARLAAALDWSAGRPDLGADERAFLQASDRDRRRRTRWLRWLVVGLASLLAVALVAGAVAVVARNDARAEGMVALSRQLAAESLAESQVDPVGAMRKAVEGWRTSPTSEARGALLSAPMLTYPAAFPSGMDSAYTVDVNLDGTLVAVGSGTGGIVLWDVAAGKALDVDISGVGAIVSVRFSPDGRFLATSALSSDNAAESGVRIWEVPSGKLVRRLRDGQPAIGQVAWRPDGTAIAAAAVRRDSTAAIGEWDPLTGNLNRWVAEGAFDTSGLAYSAAGDRLAVGHSDGSLDLWDPATATRVSHHTEHAETAVVTEGGLIPVQLAISGNLLASASVSDNLIRLWNPTTGELVRAFPDITRHTTDAGQGPSSLGFSPDGSILYTNSDANTITRWDPIGGNYLGSLPSGPRPGTTGGKAVLGLAVSRDGRTMVAGSSDGTVLRWHTNPSWYVKPSASVLDLDFHPDGRTMSAGDADGSLHTWDATTGEQTAKTTTLPGGVFAVRYTPDGMRVTGSGDATYTVTPVRGGITRPRTISFPGREFRGAMAVSADGRWLAAADQNPSDGVGPNDNKIHIWEVATLEEHAVLSLGDEWPSELVFAPAGDRLVALTSDQGNGLAGSDRDGPTAARMVTWRAPDFDDMKRVPLGTDTLSTMIFTPDGRSVLTAGTNAVIQVRDAATGRLRYEFGQHPSTIRQLAISPDGRTVASVTTEDSVVRLWHLADREFVAALTGHGAPMNQIVFSPDGRRLASGGTDTDVALWRIVPDDAIRQICANLADAGEKNLDTLGC